MDEAAEEAELTEGRAEVTVGAKVTVGAEVTEGRVEVVTGGVGATQPCTLL